MNIDESAPPHDVGWAGMTMISLHRWRAAARPLNAVVALAAGLSLLAACGGSKSSGTAARTARTALVSPGSTSPTASPTTISSPATTTTRPRTRVNANTASIAELTAAFSASGIATPDRWAREVDEYRPYPTNDSSFAKLRQELAKYNPAPGVVDQIIATLSL